MVGLFFSVTRKTGVWNDWNAFRRSRLLRELQIAVQYAMPETPHPTLRVPPPPKHEILPHVGAEERLREAVLYAVRNATLADLRALRLPVGDLFDALNL